MVCPAGNSSASEPPSFRSVPSFGESGAFCVYEGYGPVHTPHPVRAFAFSFTPSTDRREITCSLGLSPYSTHGMGEPPASSPFHRPFLGAGLSDEVQVVDAPPALVNVCDARGGELPRFLGVVTPC